MLYFKPGKDYIGVRCYNSTIKVEGKPKYIIVYSKIWDSEDYKCVNSKGEYFWLAYKYCYTPDYTGHFTNMIEGYKMIWDGAKTATELKEYCNEYDQDHK